MGLGYKDSYEQGEVPVGGITGLASEALIKGSGGVGVQVAPGTDGYVLSMVSGAVAWAAQSSGGFPTFAQISTGTNTTAAMTVGTGGSLLTSGSGTITATTAATLATARTINGTSFDGSTNITVTAAAGTLTGTTLNSSVVTSSLTSLGTIATGVWNGTKVAEAYGGTNQSTYTTGDILYASAANTLSKLAASTSGFVLTSNGVGTAPSWQAATAGVTTTGSPAANQVAYFSAAGTITGDSGLTYNGTTVTSTKPLVDSYTSTASTPAAAFTGSIFSGGTATTTKPHLLIETTGATSNAWSTAGTALGVNTAIGVTANLLDLQQNGSSKIAVGYDGKIDFANGQFRTLSTDTITFGVYTGTVIQRYTNTGTYTLKVNTVASSSQTASTEMHSIWSALAATTTWNTGPLTNERLNRFDSTTMAFGGASVVMNAMTGAFGGAPSVGSNATIINPIALQAGGATTQLTTSNGSMFYRAIDVPAHTVTLNGSTNLTATPTAAGVSIDQITLSAASALMVTNAASLYIKGAPLGGGTGPATLTNGYAILVGGGPVNLADATVSQATNINTGVTINGASGIITTQSASTAARSCETGFTVTNNAVLAGSTVVVSLSDYSGTPFTNGVPQVSVDTVATGSFHVKVCNVDATNALSGTMKIHFAVL